MAKQKKPSWEKKRSFLKEFKKKKVCVFYEDKNGANKSGIFRLWFYNKRRVEFTDPELDLAKFKEQYYDRTAKILDGVGWIDIKDIFFIGLGHYEPKEDLSEIDCLPLELDNLENLIGKRVEFTYVDNSRMIKLKLHGILDKYNPEEMLLADVIDPDQYMYPNHYFQKGYIKINNIV